MEEYQKIFISALAAQMLWILPMENGLIAHIGLVLVVTTLNYLCIRTMDWFKRSQSESEKAG